MTVFGALKVTKVQFQIRPALDFLEIVAVDMCFMRKVPDCCI